MIFKQTKLHIIDNSGLLKAKVFQVYRQNKNGCLDKHGFTYSSIRDTYQSLHHFIGKKKYLFIIHTKKTKLKKDSSSVKSLKNGSIPIKKRTAIVGKYIKGPFFYSIKRKKLFSSFNKVI